MSRLLTVATLAISLVPLYAQAQQSNAAKLKADAQKVVSIISRDKLKTQIYCEMLDLSDQIDQEENPAKTEELARKIDNLEGKLGPEFMTLVHDLSNMDPDSQDAQDIHAIIESLDGLCGD
jgi:DNA repair ATPase RecN